MLRLSTPGNTRFVQSDSFDVCYGGGEANVAVSLANYGHEAYFVSKTPKHEIGQCAINALRKYGVHTEHVARGGDRLGIYFLETGASMRPSKVIYDRADSAIAHAEVSDFDFDAIMEGASWFHWSGITPAISAKGAELTKAACIAAKKHGVKVSVDLNYRKKLWTPQQAQAVMRDLMQYVDVCIGNEEDAELCLGFKPEGTDVHSGKLDLDGYKTIFAQMKEQFGFETVCTTFPPINDETMHNRKYEKFSIIERCNHYYTKLMDMVHRIPEHEWYQTFNICKSGSSGQSLRFQINTIIYKILAIMINRECVSGCNFNLFIAID